MLMSGQIDVSQGTADRKMNESFIHTAHMSSDRACAQDGCFKCPHPTIIDGDKRSAVVGFVSVLELADV